MLEPNPIKIVNHGLYFRARTLMYVKNSSLASFGMTCMAIVVAYGWTIDQAEARCRKKAAKLQATDAAITERNRKRTTVR